MTTETETYIETGLQLLDEKEAALKELAIGFQGLTVQGIEDKEGFDKLRKARITLKGERVAIKNAAEDLRAPAVRWQKKVIEREKQLIAIIEPVEQELHAEEKRIEQLKEEARKEREMMEAKILQDRLNALAQYNFAADWVEVKHMTDEQFDTMLAHAKNLHEEELKRQAEQKAEEERKRKEEEGRMQREREELARQRAEQEAKEAEIRASREKLEREELERQEYLRKQEEEKQAWLKAEREKLEAERRAIEEEKRKNLQQRRDIRLALVYGAGMQFHYGEKYFFFHDIKLLESELDSLIDVEWNQRWSVIEDKLLDKKAQLEAERAKREAEEKSEAERLATLEAERREALRPDKEKLFEYGRAIDQFMLSNTPDLNQAESVAMMKSFQHSIQDVLQELSHDLNSL